MSHVGLLSYVSITIFLAPFEPNSGNSDSLQFSTLSLKHPINHQTLRIPLSHYAPTYNTTSEQIKEGS